MMTLSIVSGYFNPSHCGHINYVKSASNFGPVIVILNNDQQCNLKGSVCLPEQDRKKILEEWKSVWKVIISVDTDSSVLKTLQQIRESYPSDLYNLVFCNGGDRIPGSTNSAEEEFCVKNGIALAYNVGGGKTDSSSRIRNALRT